MKKEQLIGKVRYAGYLLIVMQGFIAALLAIFFLNQQYMSVWRTYPKSNESVMIYLKNVPEEKQQDTENFLLTAAAEQKLFVIRMDLILDHAGSTDGYQFGVYGNVDEHPAELSFLTENILTADDLRKLMASSNPDSTLGIETGSMNSLGNIPGFRFYEHIVLKKLPALFADSQTVNGTYGILGLKSRQAQESFLQELAAVSGLSEGDLLEAGSGSSANNLIMRDILLAFLAAQIFLNLVFFLVITMKNMPKQGKLALLGWSRTAFAKEILGRFFLFAIAAVPFLSLVNGILAGWGRPSIALLSRYLAAACINALLVLAELLFSASVIVLTRPLDAIRGRIPKKALYALGISAYLLISIGLIFCGAYVDQPMTSIGDNARLARRWDSVSGYQILSSISVGRDSDSFSGNSKELDQDLYNWYSSIADTPGVYLIQTQYYDSELLDTWQKNKTYASIPGDPFWMFTLSPNYLAELGLPVDADILASARNGVRVYLLPAGLSKEKQEQISAYLQERDTKTLSDGDIQTAFTQNPSFLFVEYDSNQDFFTWSTDPQTATETTAPIIYVATPQNMKYTETESLKASGFQGYIKFADTGAASRCTESALLSEFHLTDNELRFTDVRHYIDGLQKELGTTLLLFGIVFLLLMLILAGLLLTLAAVFRIANQEKLNVQKFLGFSFPQMYGKPILLLSTLIVIELAAMLALDSKFGLLSVVIAAVIQIVIFVKYMAHNELKNVLTALKGE